MPRGYVEDEGRPLGDACRGSRQTAPSGWSTMALVVNVGEKASLRCQVGIQKVSDPRKRRKTPLADVEIEGMASLSRQAEAAPAYGLRGIRRTGGTSLGNKGEPVGFRPCGRITRNKPNKARTS